VTAFADLSVDHVEFYVGDVRARAADLVRSYGFEAFAVSGGASGHAPATPAAAAPDEHHSIALRQGGNTVVVTQGLAETHPASLYVSQHGDGVANLGLRTGDAVAAFEAALARGARAVVYPVDWAGHDGYRSATIGAFGDVTHTFVQRPPGSQLPLGFTATTGTALGIGEPSSDPKLVEVDHFAVCLEPDGLGPTVQFYESALDFRVIFEERIVVGAQAMLSRVVQSASEQVTFTLIEPDTSAESGQIDMFLKNHGGAGVQHVAFRTDDIVHAVSTLDSRAVEFLTAPDAYYTLLAQRLELSRYTVADLRALNVLVDEDHDGQLFQIFARSTHPRRTFFFEVIERLGAHTFGSGNIKALYEAVELERVKTGDLL
jgi:4-hydroxymandelate synthase